MLKKIEYHKTIKFYKTHTKSNTQIHNKMPKANFCPCGCKVTPSTYRSKFFSRWPTGYPFQGTGLYYCANYAECENAMKKCPGLQVDHIMPESKTGINCINNLRPMCALCNNIKNAKYGDNEVHLYNLGADNLRVLNKTYVIAKQKKQNKRK